MDQRNTGDYVLGTNDEEIARLGLQHRVWRPTVLDCWRRAGITLGSRVIDVGAGPGYATMDLAEIVGPSGQVLAIERSPRFLETARNACKLRGLANVEFVEADLMERPIVGEAFDASWCRWVASFVSSPRKLIERIAAALRPGGTAIFHEYSDYRTWRLAPRRPAMEAFVDEVMKSWRENGGEPNVAVALPTLFREAGLGLIEVRPHVLIVRPHDDAWQWPASFVEINITRLLELGRVDQTWAESVRRDFAAAEADKDTLLTTPMFLEMIARRE